MPELRVETGPQKNQTFLLRPPGPYQLGRDLAADFPLFDRRASRAHFRIDFRDDGYSLTDLGSKVGTFVNNERVECTLLKPGDQIVAGRTTFTFGLDAPDDPLLGKEIGGYRILERVGKGGMGTVYRALQISLDRLVAIKVLSAEISRDADFCAMFIREARAAGELTHPNIVRVYDVNSIDGILFYVMELMVLGSVEDLLRREGRLPVDRAVHIVLQAIQGIEYAEHEKLIHRDLKPANLMVHENGTVKIGDLGIAIRAADARPGANAVGVTGSPHYMAPEQALGRSIDSKVDVYALGATLFQILTGTTPFRGQTLKEILFAHIRSDPPELRVLAPDAPESLAVLVKSMLAKDPLRRPTPASVRASLEAVLATQVKKPPPPPPNREPRWKPYATLVATSLLAIAVGIGAGVFTKHLSSKISDSNTRLERIRLTLREGRAALEAGDLDRARAKLDEISRQPAFDNVEEWQIFAPDIDKLDEAVRRASAAKQSQPPSTPPR